MHSIISLLYIRVIDEFQEFNNEFFNSEIKCFNYNSFEIHLRKNKNIRRYPLDVYALSYFLYKYIYNLNEKASSFKFMPIMLFSTKLKTITYSYDRVFHDYEIDWLYSIIRLRIFRRLTRTFEFNTFDRFNYVMDYDFWVTRPFKSILGYDIYELNTYAYWTGNIWNMNVFYKYRGWVANYKISKKYWFFKLFLLFRKKGLDFNIIYYLISEKYLHLWYYSKTDVSFECCLKFISVILKEYIKLYKFFNNSKNLLTPNDYLNNISLNNTNSNSIVYKLMPRYNQLKTKKKRLFYSSNKVTNLVNKNALESIIGQYSQFLDFNQNYGNNLFSIYYIRVQRRYNKRRYSKVRVYSRPSFFGGIALGSVFISCFWGGTIKSVDWLTTLPVVVNMNLVIIIILLLSLIRLFFIEFDQKKIKYYGKIRIYSFLRYYLINSIFFINFFLKNEKKKIKNEKKSWWFRCFW